MDICLKLRSRLLALFAVATMIFLGQPSESYATSEAFIWDSTNGMQLLGFLPGGSFSDAKDINNSGQIVGGATNSMNSSEAFIWDSVNGMQGLGDLPGGYFSSRATAINNSGQVVGKGDSGVAPFGTEAFIWDSVNGMQGLEGSFPGITINSSSAYGINDFGQVVGVVDWSPITTNVPVPSSILLLFSGFTSLVVYARKKYT